MKTQDHSIRISPAREHNFMFQKQEFYPASRGQRNGALKVYLLRFLIVAALILAVLSAGAQSPRRKVGVVLSGGGAKGIAHVGVLKALEEYQIPIDYIAGTSIGAIVGGLYAAGYSPFQIEEILMSEAFQEASRGAIDEKYNFYYLQQDPDPTWFSLTYDWESRLEYQNILKENIPTNIVSPFLMDFMFMEHLGPATAAAGNDFDELFVPFRCVASDIRAKKQVVFRTGNLPDAVRASMTFPLYFKPISIDGVMLLDGGMFNNFPSDIMLEDFNPDVIIGSIVASNPRLPDPNDLKSQLENMLMYTTNYEIFSRYGVLIKPEVPQLSVTDFSQNARVIQAGYDATMKKMGEIVSQIDSRSHPDTLAARRESFQRRVPQKMVGDIYIKGLKEDQEKFVRSFLNPGSAPLSLEQVKVNYLRMLSFTRFQHIYPRMRYDETTNTYTLCLEAEKNHEILRGLGGNISSRSVNQVFGKFHYQKLTANPKSISNNVYFGNFYRSANIAGRIDFTGEKAGFLQASMTYSQWKYTTQSVYLFEETPSSYISQREVTTDFRAGIPAGYRAKLELGTSSIQLKDQYYHTHRFARTDTADITRFSPWVTYLTYEYNTLNRKQLANEGMFLNTTLRYVNGPESNSPGSTAFARHDSRSMHSWWELQIKYEHLLFSESKLNPGVVSEIFISNRPLFSNYASSMIMARQFNPFPLAKTRYLPSFRANQYVAAGLKTMYCFSRRVQLQAEAYLFQPFSRIESSENTAVSYKPYPNDMSLMGNMALIYHTPPG
ncbi:MAG: patatin-like phospholipase family protein, partial [Bacteroidales bacterium]